MLQTFLRYLAPHIHLAAIADGSPPVGAWFGDDVEAATKWAEGWNAAQAGLYWSVNMVRPGLHAKPTKADIVGVRFAHVDVDDTQDASKVIAAGASFVLNSGAGVQGIWRLSGTVTADEVEEINRGLVAALDGDKACWNVDRLLRLPGLINYPNALKRSRGRTPAPTSLIQPDTGNRYETWAMRASFPAPARTASTGPAEAELGPWEPVSLDDLRPPLPRDVMALCQHEAAKGERSEHVSACVVALARAGCSLEEIAGLLAHPENAGLHGHIADQADPERAIRRKVALAIGHSPAAAFEKAGAAVAPVEVLPEPKQVTAARQAGVELRNGGIMMADQQIKHFADCVYVVSADKVFVPDGQLLNSSRFNATYGGWQFCLDRENKKLVREAWNAFLCNENFKAPTVQGLCFRPELAPRVVIQDGIYERINVWIPVETPHMEGDVSPFLDLLRRMLPVERDREILLSWMASLVRNPGVKFQWAPVVQGTKGNGKTTLLKVLEFCVGKDYCHFPNVDKLTRNGVNFNKWMDRRLLVGMEEIYTPGRRAFLEGFKPFVTNTRTPNEGKGVDEDMIDNCCNFLFLTNHKDGVPIDADERRYAPFFCAQQQKPDKARDGLSPDYFRRLWTWLKADGLAICNHYLRTCTIADELDPARGALEAPLTSSTSAAIEEGRGELEQEILEAIAQSTPGFRGGWISSLAADKLFKARGLRCSRQAVTKVIKALGYVPHPALGPGGQVNNAVNPDNAKPRLFCKPDSIQALNILSASDVGAAYEKANAEGLTDIAAGRK